MARAGAKIEVTAVSARNKAKNRGHDLSRLTWYDDPVKLAADANIDVFVELMGGDGDPAKAAVEVALNAGKHVITANKALLAHHGSALARLAEQKGVALNFEASVAGGIPIIKTIREGLAGNRVGKLFGIMNGTCNYILTKMANEGRSFADVGGPGAGYAEADPTFDVGGYCPLLAVIACWPSAPRTSAIDIGDRAGDPDDIRNASEMGQDRCWVWRWRPRGSSSGSPDAVRKGARRRHRQGCSTRWWWAISSAT
jgi:homoserine dehydrogenase